MRLPTRVFLLGMTLAAFSSAVAAPWTGSLETSLGVTQNQYSENWQGGAASGVAWISNINGQAQKPIGGNIEWKNILKLSFGQTHNKDPKTNDWLKPIKSADQVDFETIFRFDAGWFIDPVLSGRVETQFLDQSDSVFTDTFDPIRTTEAIGGTRTLLIRAQANWNARVSLAIRQYRDYHHRDALHATAYLYTTEDGGIQFDSDFKAPVSERISYTSKLTVFQALASSAEKMFKGQPNQDYWKATDVSWDNTFTGQLAKFLTVNLNFQLLYDKEIALGGRFKETLTLGITYLIKR